MSENTKEAIRCFIVLDSHGTREYYDKFLKNEDGLPELLGITLSDNRSEYYVFSKNILFDPNEFPRNGDMLYWGDTSHVLEIQPCVYTLDNTADGAQAKRESLRLKVKHDFQGRNGQLDALHYLATKMGWSIELK